MAVEEIDSVASQRWSWFSVPCFLYSSQQSVTENINFQPVSIAWFGEHCHVKEFCFFLLEIEGGDSSIYTCLYLYKWVIRNSALLPVPLRSLMRPACPREEDGNKRWLPSHLRCQHTNKRPRAISHRAPNISFANKTRPELCKHERIIRHRLAHQIDPRPEYVYFWRMYRRPMNFKTPLLNLIYSFDSMRK